MKLGRIPIPVIGFFLFVILFTVFADSQVVAQGNNPAAPLANPQTKIEISLTPVAADRLRAPRDSNLSFIPYLVLAPSPTPTPIPPTIPGMVFVPAGYFWMGCDGAVDIYGCSGASYKNERRMELPLHLVYLNSYYIDKYPVTNARYAACVSAGVCAHPGESVGDQTYLWNTSDTRSPYYNDPNFADYPVIRVNWFDANNFCRWEGKRLLTEAEWEKAARGHNDTRVFSWGTGAIDCTMANYRSDGGLCVQDTSRVGSYPVNVSPYGVIEMNGNVWNWINDWYQEDYYLTSPWDNPQGPNGPMLSTESNCDNCKVVRGGSWDFTANYTRLSYRGRLNPFIDHSVTDTAHHDVGIRCARSY